MEGYRIERRWLLSYLAVVGSALIVLLICSAAYADQEADPRPITWKSCSSTIAVGGTAQNAPASPAPIPSLRGYFLQNPSTATESLFFDASGAAVTPAGTSPELIAGASLSYGPGTIFFGTMSVNAVTSGHAYVCQYGQ